MIEPIPVEARFELDGSLRPIAFEWQNQRYTIESHGRQWQEDATQHFLVMVSGNQIFELAYYSGTNQWHLIRRPQDFNRPSVV